MQPTIGDNIGQLRRATAMTQEALAEAAGVSVETVRKLEQNERTSARMSTLNRLARALRVSTSSLVGNAARTAAQGEPDHDQLALLELRRTLTPARGLRGALLGGPEVEPPTLDDVRGAVRQLDRAYHADDYATTLAGLPLLIAEARTAVDEITGDDRAVALEMMAQAYQLAGTALIQLRAFDLAHRALSAALDAWLLLRAAAAAVRDNRDDDAESMLDGAAAAAARIGDRVPDEVLSPGPATIGAFCHTTVEWKRIESAVIAGHPDRALELSRTVPPSDRPTSNNRNRHLLDVASVHAQVGAFGPATTVLLGLRDAAPSWLRHQRYARDIVATIVSARKRCSASRRHSAIGGWTCKKTGAPASPVPMIQMFSVATITNMTRPMTCRTGRPLRLPRHDLSIRRN